MKPKITPLEIPENGTRCVPFFLPDDDALIARFNSQAFKYLSAPSYYFNLPGAAENARLWEGYWLKNLSGGDCVVIPRSMLDGLYTIPPSCVGGVKAFATQSPPANYLRCDGREYKKEDYPELFGAIASVFRTSESTFRVPDIRSRVVADGTMGDVVGSNSGMLQTSQMPSHDHQINLQTSEESAPHNHGGLTGLAPAAHNHGGQTLEKNVPHNHGGKTGTGNSTFYRTVSEAGTLANSNHVTGFKSASNFVDRTDGGWPMRVHDHNVQIDNISHNHDIPLDLAIHQHNIQVDDVTHAHGVVGNTQSWPGGTQSALDMRQETIELNYYICCASERITDMGMTYLRRSGNDIQQTRNGGADWEYLWTICECESLSTNPQTGQPVTTIDISIANQSNATVGGAVVDGTYNEGNYGDGSTYSDAVINEAICAAINVFVNGMIDVVGDNWDGDRVQICELEKIATVGSVLGGLAGVAASIYPLLGPILFKIGLGTAAIVAVCEAVETIATVIRSDDSFFRNRAARDEIICFMVSNVDAPLSFVKWQSSLQGFSGSSDAEKLAGVLQPILTDPALYGEFFDSTQQYVEIADGEALPCPCGSEEPCSENLTVWADVPTTPEFPAGYSIAPNNGVFDVYGIPLDAKRDTTGTLSRGQWIASGFNSGTPRSLGLLYTIDNPCFIQNVVGIFENIGSSYICAIYCMNEANNWVRVGVRSRFGPGSPVVISMNVPVGFVVRQVAWTHWDGSPRMVTSGWNT